MPESEIFVPEESAEKTAITLRPSQKVHPFARAETFNWNYSKDGPRTVYIQHHEHSKLGKPVIIFWADPRHGSTMFTCKIEEAIVAILKKYGIVGECFIYEASLHGPPSRSELRFAPVVFEDDSTVACGLYGMWLDKITLAEFETQMGYSIDITPISNRYGATR